MPGNKILVVKRDGSQQEVHYDKIIARLLELSYELDGSDPALLAQQVCSSVHASVTTKELYHLAAEAAANMVTIHPDYMILATRIAVANIHKSTKKDFSAVVEDMYNYVNPRTGKKEPLVAKNIYKIVQENKDRLDSAIVHDRDLNYDFFEIKTLERAWLLKINDKIVERPQHMLMRRSIAIHGSDIESAIDMYNLMSDEISTLAGTSNLHACRTQALAPQLLEYDERRLDRGGRQIAAAITRGQDRSHASVYSDGERCYNLSATEDFNDAEKHISEILGILKRLRSGNKK